MTTSTRISWTHNFNQYKFLQYMTILRFIKQPHGLHWNSLWNIFTHKTFCKVINFPISLFFLSTNTLSHFPSCSSLNPSLNTICAVSPPHSYEYVQNMLLLCFMMLFYVLFKGNRFLIQFHCLLKMKISIIWRKGV